MSSLSKIKQARAFRPLSPSKPHTDGFHCSFVFEPLKCPICELIPRDAYKVNCCQRHYCKDCISSLEENYSTCPGCGKTITYSRDEKYNDVILQFEVYCKNKCGWKGPLGEHDSHMHINPSHHPLQDIMVADAAAPWVADAAAPSPVGFIEGMVFGGIEVVVRAATALITPQPRRIQLRRMSTEEELTDTIDIT